MKKNLLLLKNLQILRNSQVYDFNIKKVYIDKLDGKVNKCNNAYHNTMKPINVKSITYINLNKENNKEDSRFNVDLHVRTSKHKNIFAKGYTTNWSEE